MVHDVMSLWSGVGIQNIRVGVHEVGSLWGGGSVQDVRAKPMCFYTSYTGV